MDLSEENRENLLVTNSEYTIESGSGGMSQPIVHLYCRDVGGNRRHVEVEGFRPYFHMAYDEFVDKYRDVINDRHVMGIEADLDPEDFDLGADTPDGVADALTGAASGQTTVYHRPGTYDALDSTKTVKVLTIEPTHVGKIREYWDRTWEADVPFDRRFRISADVYRGISIPSGASRVRYENWDGYSGSDERIQEIRPADPPETSARMIVVDIEVATHGGGVPSVTDAPHEVTAITAYDNYDEEYTAWLLESEQWDTEYSERDIRNEVSDRLDIDLASFSVYDTEAKLLENFNQWVLESNPDIMTAWNADFDFPYLINRSYNVSAYSIREWDDFGNPGAWESDSGRLNTKVDGRVVWDSLEAYEKTQFRDLESYSLDNVAQKELGMGKVEIDDLDEGWHNDPIDFLVYNVRDVQAVVDIEQQSELIELFENLREVTGASYTTCYNNGPMLDTMFLREAFDSRIVLPTNEPVPPEEGNFHGAKVIDPVPGKQDNSAYLDLSSLYPSIMLATNIGRETVIGDEEDLAESEYTEDEVIRVPVDNREWKEVPKGETYDDIDRDKYKGVLTPKGGQREIFEPKHDDMYIQKPEENESFIRSTIDDLIDLKYQYSGNRYKATKRVTNSCVSPDTEVLTPDGVRNIRDLYIGDTVYALDDETNTVEEKKVVDTIRNTQYEGDIIDISTTRIDLSLTPDHRMFVKRRRHTDNFEWTTAGELNNFTRYELPNNWDYNHGSYFGDTVDVYSLVDDVVEREIHTDGEMFGAKKGNPNIRCEWDTENFIKFLAWYITEGNTYDGEHRGWFIDISQKDESGRDKIRGLIEDIGLNYYEDCNGFRMSSKVLAPYLDEVCGAGSENKKLPDFVWDMSEYNKELLLEYLMYGDGDKYSGNRYSTQSTRLRDDVLKLCTEIGYNTSYSRDSDCWRIRFDDGSNTFQMGRGGGRGARSVRESSDGVYCITVEDNHTMLAGRNGSFSWIGQCYGVLGDSNSSGGRGFRLFDRKNAEAITLIGREVLGFTADKSVEYTRDNLDEEARVVGGDTDASVVSAPGEHTFGELFDHFKETASYVDSEYDKFMEEEFNIPPELNTMEVELESLASGLFFSQDMDADDPENKAVKKRYAQHIVWDDDDGWLDLPEDVETEYDVLEDPDDKSTLKTLNDITYDDYEEFLDGDPEDDVEITGFEFVRSDTATMTKKSQLRILSDILLAEDPADRIYEFLSDYVDSVKDGSVPNGDIGRRKGISNNLDDYGWKTVEELEEDSNYDVTDEDRENGGRYVATPGPTYRGAKYATDHIPWEEHGAGSKPMRFYIENVKGTKFPEVYTYDTFPRDGRPDPPEVDRELDAICVDDPERIPIEFELDREKMIEKELEDKLQPILQTIGEDWDGIVGEGRQSGLDQWT